MNNKIKENYTQLAQSLGLHFDENAAAIHGKRGTYEVTIYAPNSNYPYILTAVISAKRSSGVLSNDVCKEFKRSNKIVSKLEHKGNLISMHLKNIPNQIQLQERLGQALNAFIALLNAQGFQSCCQLCALDNPSTCMVSGSFMSLCSECYNRVRRETSLNLSTKQSKHENVIGGIVGALLGSLLGVLSIIILSQMGYVAVISGIIMAICTLKGYEMLGGKLSKRGIIISCILMVVMTYFGDRLDWAIIISRDIGIDLFTSFQIFPEVLREGAIDMGGYIMNLILQFLFVVGGAIPTISSTIKNQANEGVVFRLGENPHAADLNME